MDHPHFFSRPCGHGMAWTNLLLDCEKGQKIRLDDWGNTLNRLSWLVARNLHRAQWDQHGTSYDQLVVVTHSLPVVHFRDDRGSTKQCCSERVELHQVFSVLGWCPSSTARVMYKYSIIQYSKSVFFPWNHMSVSENGLYMAIPCYIILYNGDSWWLYIYIYIIGHWVLVASYFEMAPHVWSSEDMRLYVCVTSYHPLTVVTWGGLRGCQDMIPETEEFCKKFWSPHGHQFLKNSNFFQNTSGATLHIPSGKLT